MSSLIGGGATFASLQAVIGADISGALKGFKAAEVAGAKTATKLTAIGGAMAKGFGLALLGIGIAATKMAVDFEKGMSKIATLIPGQTQRLEQLGDAINDVRIKYGKTADDIQEGTFQVISAFGDSIETVGRLDVVARAATAGFSTTQEALNLLSAVTKGYGDTSIEALNKVSDLAFLTNKLGQTTFPELAASMGGVVPVAKVLNVSQEELFATFATLTGVTGSTSEVATQFESILRALIKPTEDMITALDALGFTTGEQAIETLGLQGTLEALVAETDGTSISIGKLFSRMEGMGALLALTGAQSDKFTTSLGSMGRAGGETIEAVGEVGKTTAFALSQMTQKLAVMTEEIGNQLLPVLKSLMDLLGPLAEAFLKISGPILGFLGSAIQATAELFTENLGEIDDSFKDTRSTITSAVDAIIKDLKRLGKEGTEALIVNLKSQLANARKELELGLLAAFAKLRPIPLRSLIGFEAKAFKGEFDDLINNQEALIELRTLLNAKDVEAQGNLRFLLESYGLLNVALGEAEKRFGGLAETQEDVIATSTAFINIEGVFTALAIALNKSTEAFTDFAFAVSEADKATAALQKALDGFDPSLFAASTGNIFAEHQDFEEVFFGDGDVIPKVESIFKGIGDVASDAFGKGFQQNFNEFSDFGRAFAIGFGDAFTIQLTSLIGRLPIADAFKSALAAATPAISSALQSSFGADSDLSRALSGAVQGAVVGARFGPIGAIIGGFGGAALGLIQGFSPGMDHALEQAKAMEKLNDAFADFNTQLDDVLDGTEKWDQAFVDLFSSFKTNNLLDIDSVFMDIADAITSVGDEIEKTKSKLAQFPATLFDSRLALDNVKNALVAARAELIKIKEEVGKQFVQRTQGEIIQEGKRRVESLGIAELELITLKHDKIAAEKALTKAIEEGKAAEAARARLAIASTEQSIKAKLREIKALKEVSEPTIKKLEIIGLAGDNVGQRLAGREAFRELKRQINKAAEDNRISADEQAVILAQTTTEETAILALQLIEARKAVLEAVRAVEREKQQIEIAKEQRRFLRLSKEILRARLTSLVDLQKRFNEEGVQFLGRKLDDIVRAIKDIPSMQSGSGGPLQKNQLIFAHAGETIVPAGQSMGGPITVNFVVDGQILQSVVVPAIQTGIDNGQTRFPTGTLVKAGMF